MNHITFGKKVEIIQNILNSKIEFKPIRGFKIKIVVILK